MSNDARGFSRRGLMFVLSSPSGAGKTTLTRRLMNADPEAALSVSATTRPPRPGEIDGKDYFFVDEAGFTRMIDEDAFLEWAHVFGNRYGTPRAAVEERLSKGADVVFDVDWQGARALAAAAPDDVVRVFILPPSVEELERRLNSRGDAPDVIARRMDRAVAEISHWPEYDYVLVNDDVERCFEALTTIFAAERLRRTRQTGIAGLAAAMSRRAE
jgi:guanylate kinase